MTFSPARALRRGRGLLDEYRPPEIRFGAVIAVGALAALLVWYFAIRDTGNGNRPARTGQGPVATSRSDLVELSNELGRPVYWAGRQPGTTLELTQTQDGNVYVRYLTENATLGSPRPSFLTVATYPVDGARQALEATANERGATTTDLPDGGLAVRRRDAPSSVYLAYPQQDFQIEVYDPDPKRALDLVESGDVRPVR